MIIGRGRGDIASFILRPPFLQFRQQRFERLIDIAERLQFRHHLVGPPYPLLQQAAQGLAPHTIRNAALLRIGMAPDNKPALAQCPARRFLGQACLANARFSQQRNALRARPLNGDGRADGAMLLLHTAVSRVAQRLLGHAQQLPQCLALAVASDQRALVAAPEMRLFRIE